MNTVQTIHIDPTGQFRWTQQPTNLHALLIEGRQFVCHRDAIGHPHFIRMDRSPTGEWSVTNIDNDIFVAATVTPANAGDVVFFEPDGDGWTLAINDDGFPILVAR